MATYYVDYENGNDDTGDGLAWGTAWKTIDKATAEASAGDTVRVAKSPAPVSIGNGTWTNQSKTVTLAVAQTLTIDNCETEWTLDGALSVARATSAKEGTYYCNLRAPGTASTETLMAHFTLDEGDGIDFSAYQKISLWVQSSASLASGNQWVICLCSDTAGETVVDSFTIPSHIVFANRWSPVTITKEGGGNLGSAIKSIAVYTGTTSPTTSSYLRLDNIIACTASGLNLQSLISKISAEQGTIGEETWHGIQSIDGVTVLLDNSIATLSTEGTGYYGTTETVATYIRETIKAEATNAVFVTIGNSGTAGNHITIIGGWNPSDGEQDGETFFDGLGSGSGVIYAANRSYITLDRFGTVRGNYGFDIARVSTGNTEEIILQNCRSLCNQTDGIIHRRSSGSLFRCDIIDCQSSNNTRYGVHLENVATEAIVNNLISLNNISHGVYVNYQNNILQKITVLNNGQDGIYLLPGSLEDGRFGEFICKDNANYGVHIRGQNYQTYTIVKIITSGNGNNGVYFFRAYGYVINATCDEAIPVGTSHLPTAKTFIGITNLNGSSYYEEFGYTLTSEATAREGGSGLMWKMALSNAFQSDRIPATISAKVAVVANKLVTIKAWVKKSHASNVGAKLFVENNALAGIDDTEDVKASDTNWEELSISFTPTQAGVVEAKVGAWYVTDSADVYVDEINITQAD